MMLENETVLKRSFRKILLSIYSYKFKLKAILSHFRLINFKIVFNHHGISSPRPQPLCCLDRLYYTFCCLLLSGSEKKIKKHLCICFLTKSLKGEMESKTPTWTAYNSLIIKALPITIYCGLPLYPAQPTDWTNLTSLQICQNISSMTNPEGKTIISLDLQLNEKVLQLQSKDEINRNFVFHAGELDVFAFFHTMGKYIVGSGLEQLFLEVGIYRPVTVHHILKGNHMKRGMEAYTTLYLALHKLYIKQFFEAYPYMEDKLRNTFLVKFTMEAACDQLHYHHDDLNAIDEEEIFVSLKIFDEQLQHQSKFLHSFKSMHEILLLFTRATRQGIWYLYLASLVNDSILLCS